MEPPIRMQLAYDLAQAREEEKSIAVKRYVAEGGAHAWPGAIAGSG
ncbi:MAG TPA: hypothetical protein VL523_14675 [Terriglobia bacterium]|nr:hypothetical protein [Terriglobia bacterium]